jgi:glycosyltransferase involved in cell wall biosynthesis
MLVMCSKSPWLPSIRREHALTEEALRQGHRVVFVEAPLDSRAVLMGEKWRWARGFVAGKTVAVSEELAVITRSTLAPGHRGRSVGAVDSGLLGRILRRFDAAGTAIVIMAPWQWPAVSRLRRARVVFDCADDWSRLLSSSRARIPRLYGRISAEAARVIVNNPSLCDLFERRDIAVVPNGTPRAALATAITPPPRERKLVYAGTLSERFDVDLVRQVMVRLPEWSLALYGECRYRRCGDRPAPELGRLLEEFKGRILWHGVLDRASLSACLDDADVLVLPHRRTGAITGDAMKLYDYAARGRPIVSTAWSDGLATSGPPHLYLAVSATEWDVAITQAIEEPPSHALERRSWAAGNTWSARWMPWSDAVFGDFQSEDPMQTRRNLG